MLKHFSRRTKDHLMGEIEIYVLLLAIVVGTGILFRTSKIPVSLILVITGIGISLFINFPKVDLNPDLVFDVFLPMLLYEISGFSSWHDVKKNFGSITLLSVGHVLFITFLAAAVIHLVVPQIGWPLAFVIGSIISPPDDVAIAAIGEKIDIPKRLLTILEGEGMFNDATALILFRFALAVTLTQHFFPLKAISTFFIIILAETGYGLLLGFILGKIRMRIKDPILHMMISLLTPFLAYLPAENLGGSGVISTVITGLVIGHYFLVRFPPDVRLAARSLWPTLAYALQNFLFLLVGLNMQFILENLSAIPTDNLTYYMLVTIASVMIGRFIWVYPATYLPRLLFPALRKRDPYLPWQYPFIISWAGLRGGISLAAALSIPSLPHIDGVGDPRDFVIFLVFSVIIATLVLQGISLPWVVRLLGIQSHHQREQHQERSIELAVRAKMVKAVLKWLHDYKSLASDSILLEQIDSQIQNYQILKKQLKTQLKMHDGLQERDDRGIMDAIYLEAQMIEIERKVLLSLWREKKIPLTVRNKLLLQLDHRANQLKT